jgi:DNA-binding NtrC family response regulator
MGWGLTVTQGFRPGLYYFGPSGLRNRRAVTVIFEGSMSAVFTNGPFASAVIASSNGDFRRKIVQSLRSASCNVREAQGGADALAKLEGESCQALLLDNWLPDLDVGELLHIVKRRHPQVRVLIVNSETGEQIFDASQGDLEEVMPGGDARPSGAVDITSPEAAPEQEESKGALPPEPLPGMIGASDAMRNMYRMSRLVALRSTTVLLTGETGTGKELVAKAIHLLSPRHRQPFITVNCAAIPESLLESELFGYARGAFTGAFQSRMGRIHAAHGGTLFLDEVGDLPLSMQAKLLRFLQEGEVQRLGGPDIIRVDVRVISATNAELAKRVAEKAFREDLYYRVSAFPIDLVPLRERPEDILSLSGHFLRLFCEEANVAPKVISEAAGRLIEKHAWPGNVRELKHVMERAFILSEDNPSVLPEHIRVQTPWR